MRENILCPAVVLLCRAGGHIPYRCLVFNLCRNVHNTDGQGADAEGVLAAAQGVRGHLVRWRAVYIRDEELCSVNSVRWAREPL